MLPTNETLVAARNVVDEQIDKRIEELLTTTGTAQPILADKQENGQTDTVPDEGGAHDEMGQTLTEMIIATETERGNATK